MPAEGRWPGLELPTEGDHRVAFLPALLRTAPVTPSLSNNYSHPNSGHRQWGGGAPMPQARTLSCALTVVRPAEPSGNMARVAPLMLLDSASMYFRAYYGIPPESMTAPDGTPVNAVRGLLDMIARLVRARRPGSLIACMDVDWRPKFRVAAIPSYKEHRANPDGSEQVPDALNAQIPVITEVLAAAGVAMAGAA